MSGSGGGQAEKAAAANEGRRGNIQGGQTDHAGRGIAATDNAHPQRCTHDAAPSRGRCVRGRDQVFGSTLEVGDHTETSGVCAAKEIIHGSEPITAVLASNDRCAVGALYTLLRGPAGRWSTAMRRRAVGPQLLNSRRSASAHRARDRGCFLQDVPRVEQTGAAHRPGLTNVCRGHVRRRADDDVR